MATKVPQVSLDGRRLPDTGLYAYICTEHSGPGTNRSRITIAEANAQLERLAAAGINLNVYMGSYDTPLPPVGKKDQYGRKVTASDRLLASMEYNSVTVDWEAAADANSAAEHAKAPAAYDAAWWEATEAARPAWLLEWVWCPCIILSPINLTANELDWDRTAP